MQLDNQNIGIDINFPVDPITGLPDLDPTFASIKGRLALIQAIQRRLYCARGYLFRHQEYGIDIRDYLNGIYNQFRLTSDIKAEILKDERVLDCAVSSTFSAENSTVYVAIQMQDDEGPFNMTLNYNTVSAELIWLS